MSTDRIDKNRFASPLKRIWRALSDPEEFAAWFGMKFDGPFKAGAHLRGTIVGIDRVEPERLFSFLCHPHAIGHHTDYSQEPTTLVEFTLEKGQSGNTAGTERRF